MENRIVMNEDMLRLCAYILQPAMPLLSQKAAQAIPCAVAMLMLILRKQSSECHLYFTVFLISPGIVLEMESLDR